METVGTAAILQTQARTARAERLNKAVPIGQLQALVDAEARAQGVAATARPRVCVLSTHRFASRTYFIIRQLVKRYDFRLVEIPETSPADAGRALRSVVEQIARQEPLVCWACYPYKDGLAALYAWERFRIPYVLTLRGEWWHGRGRGLESLVEREWIRIAAMVVTEAPCVVSLTHTFMRGVVSRYPHLATKEYLRIPNGVGSFAVADTRPLRVAVELPRPYITTATNFAFQEKRRAVLDLVEAFDQRAWSGSLLIAGKEGQASLARGRVGHCGYNFGFRANGLGFLKLGAVFVYNSYLDSQPSVLMEAMALGLPCVVRKHASSGAAEFIEDGRTGVLFEALGAAVDAVEAFLEDKEASVRYGEAARRAVAAKYSWARVGVLYNDAFSGCGNA